MKKEYYKQMLVGGGKSHAHTPKVHLFLSLLDRVTKPNSQILSKHRNELMGLSIILVMLYHTLPFFNHGDIGVEFFFILSSLGCIYSLSKTNNTKKFLLRRANRIIPTFTIIGIISYVFLQQDVPFLFFMLHNGHYWFIYTIIICYLITPYFLRTPNKYYKTITFSVIVFVFAIYEYPSFRFFIKIIDRIPIYLASLLIIKCSNDNRNITNTYRTHFLIGSFVSLALILFIGSPKHIISIYCLYLFTSIPILHCIAFIIDRYPYFNKSLAFIGRYTLELYLSHWAIIILLEKIISNNKIAIILSYISALTVSILLNYCISKIRFTR